MVRKRRFGFKPALEVLEQRMLPSTNYNAAADFSVLQNPNGAWSYGWTPTLGGPFTIDTSTKNTQGTGVDAWLGNISGDGAPSVAHNATGKDFTNSIGIFVPASQLVDHPGPGGQDSIVRWTAPTAGSVSLNAVFTGVDGLGGTTTDVHVLLDGASLFDGNINGFGNKASYLPTQPVNVVKGDTIDFAVGFGTDGGYFFDSTAVDATVSPATIGNPVLTLNLTPFSPVEGQPVNSVPVATFTDTNAAAVNSTVTMSWGDGETSSSADHNVTVEADPNHQNVFNVLASKPHPYSEDSASLSYQVTVVDPAGSSGTGSSHVAVADAPLRATGQKITATEGVAGDMMIVATFIDTGGREDVKDYSAAIDWGDGASSSGQDVTIVPFGNDGQTFAVEAKHTYAAAGTFTTDVHLIHENGITADASASAVVVDPIPTITRVNISSRASFDATLRADYQDLESEPHTLVVSWGDGANDTMNLGTQATGSFAIPHRYQLGTVGPWQPFNTVFRVMDNNGSASAPLVLPVIFVPRKGIVPHSGTSSVTPDVALTTSANSVNFGTAVTFTATVSGLAAVRPGVRGGPTGTVDFVDATTGVDLGSRRLTNGTAQLTTAVLAAGSHLIVAIYNGDGNFTGNSAGIAESVLPSPTRTVVTASPTASVLGQPVTFFANVTTGSKLRGTPVTSGTVHFVDTTTGADLGTQPLRSGVAVLTVSMLSLGAHAITATYSGDGHNVAGSSGNINESVSLGDGAPLDLNTEPRRVLSRTFDSSGVITYKVDLLQGDFLFIDGRASLLNVASVPVNLIVFDSTGTLLTPTPVHNSPDPATGKGSQEAVFGFQADHAGTYYVRLQNNFLANLGLELHRLALATGDINPGDLNQAGPMYAFLKDGTLYITGPTGYGFGITGNWTRQGTALPGRPVVSTYTATGALTLQSAVGPYDLTVKKGRAFTVTTAANTFGAVFGAITSLDMNLDLSLENYTNALSGYSKQLGIGISLGAPEFKWQIELGNQVRAEKGVNQLLDGVPYLVYSGSEQIAVQFGSVVINIPIATIILNGVLPYVFIDPADPYIYLHIPKIPGTDYPQLNLGLSERARIPYVPTHAPSNHDGAMLANFYGDLFYSLSQDVPIPGTPPDFPVGMTIGGDVTVNSTKGDVAVNGTLAIALDDVLRNLAHLTNNDLAKLIPLSLQIADVSVVYNNELHGVWFKGTAGADNPLAGTPLAAFVPTHQDSLEGAIFSDGRFYVTFSDSYSYLGFNLVFRFTLDSSGVTAQVEGDGKWEVDQFDYAEAHLSGTLHMGYDAQAQRLTYSGSLKASGKLVIAGVSNSLDVGASIDGNKLIFDLPDPIGKQTITLP